jgi:transposase
MACLKESVGKKAIDTDQRISKLVAMRKTFRSYDLNQRLLLPADLREWLPDEHLALYVSDVVEQLDLSEILNSYEEDLRGRPPYHPAMMVKLLIYGYCTGRMSSRKLEQATYDDVAFRVLSCNQHPDHDSLAEFRKRHLAALSGLFLQVLQLCQRAGLVKLGHVAVDSTRIKANAAKRQSLSYARLNKAERELSDEVTRLLNEAQSIDEQEDRLYGKGKRGDELPPELRQRETRLAKIRELKAELEREAKEAAEQENQRKQEQKARKAKGEAVIESYRKPMWVKSDDGEIKPKPGLQRNLTDRDSRVMMNPMTRSFEQAYNAQIAVDAEAQIIVAATVVQASNDAAQLLPALMSVKQNLRQLPAQATADAGYFSATGLADEQLKDVDLYVPPHNPPGLKSRPTLNAVIRDQMRAKLQRPGGYEIYKRRNIIVEPVFAEIKHLRQFRQFRLRGLAPVVAEWSLVCMTHNLLKLFRAHRQLAAI